MRLKVAPARDLPAPGATALEVLACDLSRRDGRWAVRRVCGKRSLREFLKRGVRFVTVAIGAGGARVAVPYTEAEFIRLGADIIDCMGTLPGPIVVTPFGLPPQLRAQLIAAAERRDLETVEPQGHA